MANIRVMKNGIAIPIPPYVVEKGDDAVVEYVDRFPPGVLAGGDVAVARDYEVKLAEWNKKVADDTDAKARKYIHDAGSANAPLTPSAPAPADETDDSGD